jgi:polar amino acid transport system ATP-binding protein
LLRCINGLEPVQGGEVHVDGVAVHQRAADLRSLRARVGFVFQSYNLFPHLTVEDNVTLGLRIVQKVGAKEASDVARQALRRVGLEDKIKAYADELSGGQQQRVAIARSLAMSPRIMLFDEITSALDPELVGEVLKVLETMAGEGMTMLLVTHEMNFARRVADRVVFMHQGKVWEQGPAEQVFAAPQTDALRQFLSAVLH